MVNHWASRLTSLSQLPLEMLTLNDFSWMQKKIHYDSKISKQERNWLKFMHILLAQSWQHEIELEEAAKLNLSNIDIELEDN